MPSRVCWWCDALSNMTMVDEPRWVEADASFMAAYYCNNCDHLSLGQFYGGLADAGSIHTTMTRLDIQLDWLPPAKWTREFPDVPKHIASAASEAHRCGANGLFRAAVVMARSVVEATAKNKGITKGKLVQKIDEMHKQELIRTRIRDAAHEIRFLGNDMAHGDFVEPVTKEESDEILDLMAFVLSEVYQEDARTEARRRARLAKEAVTQSADETTGTAVDGS